MVPDPALAEMSSPDAPSSRLLTQLEAAQNEGVQLRREVVRWKMLARQHEGRLKDIESSVGWRILGVVRILPELRHRWKLLVLVGVLACLSLPLWPLLAILMCFASGRDLVWRVLWKIQPLQDLMGFVRQKLLSHIGGPRGEVGDLTPLIYHRPTGVESPTEGMTRERANWLLLQQLSPQQRTLLQRYRLTKSALITDDETPDLLSLSRTEVSVLKISTGTYSPKANASVC
jgi:hypothetical protein